MLVPIQDFLDRLKQNNNFILHNNRLWFVNLVFTPDLPASCELFGWIHYYSPATKVVKCIYCGADDSTFWKFGSCSFQMQAFEALVRNGECAVQLQSSVQGMEVWDVFAFTRN